MDPMLEGAAWLDEELAGSTFADARLGQRLRRLLEQLGGAMGASLPLACQDWAATKAAYRFFDNGRVSEAQIAYSDEAGQRFRLITGHPFRFHSGRDSDLKPATFEHHLGRC